MIFVFGSNLAGRHGKGAALYAIKHHGAIYGIGEGRQGGSYAIPTKTHRLESLSLNSIQYHVNLFLQYAKEHPELEFQLTPIGCGLAGYRPEEIAPMFKNYTKNISLPNEFKGILNDLL